MELGTIHTSFIGNCLQKFIVRNFYQNFCAKRTDHPLGLYVEGGMTFPYNPKLLENLKALWGIMIRMVALRELGWTGLSV